MNKDERIELLIELCKSQHKTLRHINKVMFDATKHQRSLPKEKRNIELLDLVWATNDMVSDNPREDDLIKTLNEKYGINILEGTQ